PLGQTSRYGMLRIAERQRLALTGLGLLAVDLKVCVQQRHLLRREEFFSKLDQTTPETGFDLVAEGCHHLRHVDIMPDKCFCHTHDSRIGRVGARQYRPKASGEGDFIVDSEREKIVSAANPKAIAFVKIDLAVL